MYLKIGMIDTAGMVAGAAVCTVLAVVLVSGLGQRSGEPALAEAGSLRAARYQPAAGEPSMQIRQARNEAMATTDGAAVVHCPRCR